jgi:predicted nucleic acid-binding protein
MSALVLDAGALIAIDKGERAVLVEVGRALRSRQPVCTNAMALAQAWRDGRGRQATLARALRDITVEPITGEDGMRAGELLGRARLRDAIHASVALLAGPGDRVLTGDPDDLQRLCDVAGNRAVVVDC